MQDNDEVAVRSCNASGKTFTASGIVHQYLLAYNDAIVLTTAPTGRQVREVLWREIRNSAQGKGLYDPAQVLETKINVDDKNFALGLSTDQEDQFQGWHSPHLLVIVDEASGIDEKIFEAIDGLKPTKLLLLGNPLRNSGRFFKVFSDVNVKKIHISAFDTPNVKQGKVVIPGLITLGDVQKFKERYGEDSDVYRVRILGEFPKAEADSLISIDEIDKAIKREVVPIADWEKRLGVDVARYGDDRTVFTIRQMDKVIWKEIMSKKGNMEVAGKAITLAREYMVQGHNIFIDGIGNGSGVVDAMREQGWAVNDVNSALPAEDAQHYGNLRAEHAFKLKEWLKTGQLPNDDEYYEMTNIKYKFNHKGQIFLESKEDIKKRGLPSPDAFDSLALTFAKNIAQEFGAPSNVATDPLPPMDPSLGF